MASKIVADNTLILLTHRKMKCSCDRLVSIIHPQLHLNIFSSETVGLILLKLHRKHSLSSFSYIPSKLLDPGRTLAELLLPWQWEEKNLKISSSESAQGISMEFCRDILWLTFVRWLQLMLIHWKTWPPVGRAFLPYMSIVQTLKIFFSESVLRISIKFYRDVIWMTLSDSFSSCLSVKKHGCK